MKAKKKKFAKVKWIAADDQTAFSAALYLLGETPIKLEDYSFKLPRELAKRLHLVYRGYGPWVLFFHKKGCLDLVPLSLCEKYVIINGPQKSPGYTNISAEDKRVYLSEYYCLLAGIERNGEVLMERGKEHFKDVLVTWLRLWNLNTKLDMDLGLGVDGASGLSGESKDNRKTADVSNPEEFTDLVYVERWVNGKPIPPEDSIRIEEAEVLLEARFDIVFEEHGDKFFFRRELEGELEEVEVTPALKFMLVLVMLNAGGRIDYDAFNVLPNFPENAEACAERIQEYKKRLKILLGPKLHKKIFDFPAKHAYPLRKDGWSFCWIRRERSPQLEKYFF